jgi:hypothetical protein
VLVANGDRIVKMLLEVTGGVLEENLTIEEEIAGGNRKNIPHKKLQKRTTKREFRENMKDPSKFEFTELADPDHPTIIVRESPGGGVHDEISFFHFEGFRIAFQPHPDVIEEFETAPDGPFTKGGNVLLADTAVDQGGGASPEKFKAGPYRVAPSAKNQKFWKFLIITDSGLTLDPCIVTE